MTSQQQQQQQQQEAIENVLNNYEEEDPEWPVSLHVYDLSNGMAAMFSRQFIGKQIDGIWHTGIVVYDKEYYFGGGIQCDDPAQTPYGTPVRRLRYSLI